eukprot:3971423-Amphidinium_carterae.2
MASRIKKCTILSGGIDHRVNFIIRDASCPIIGNPRMEENQCYAVVKPPGHKSWIMSLHSVHGTRLVKIGKRYYICSLTSHGWVCQQGATQQVSDQCMPAERVTQRHLRLKHGH